MVKVTISLPNNAHITFESEEPEVIHDIVTTVLRDLPRDLMQSSPASRQGAAQSPNGNGAAAPPSVKAVPPAASGPKEASQAPSPGAAKPAVPIVAAPAAPAPDGQRAYREFCQRANPVGDMRKLVAAAEGARRFLGQDSVDADDLSRLFELAGWRQPHSFTQAIRNAARAKFRWLERVPGRAGRYAVSEVGRRVVLGGDQPK